jgi:hypothetical protein
MKTGYDNLLKVLKNHRSYCKIHEFSLHKDRHCTCGVEKAREELSALLRALEPLAQIGRRGDEMEYYEVVLLGSEINHAVDALKGGEA